MPCLWVRIIDHLRALVHGRYFQDRQADETDWCWHIVREFYEEADTRARPRLDGLAWFSRTAKRSGGTH